MISNLTLKCTFSVIGSNSWHVRSHAHPKLCFYRTGNMAPLTPDNATVKPNISQDYQTSRIQTNCGNQGTSYFAMVLAVNIRSHFIDLLGDLTRFFLADLTQEELNRLVDKYQPLIRSKRVASYISNIGDLLEVLEARNEVNEGNVEVLKEIGELLQRPGVSQRIEAYKRLIIPPVVLAPVIVPVAPTPAAISSVLSIPLQRVFKTISETIGSGWRELGRNLGVKEQDIIQIYTRCCNDPIQSADQVLRTYWEQNPRANHMNEIKDAIGRMNRQALLRKINEVLSSSPLTNR